MPLESVIAVIVLVGILLNELGLFARDRLEERAKGKSGHLTPNSSWEYFRQPHVEQLMSECSEVAKRHSGKLSL